MTQLETGRPVTNTLSSYLRMERSPHAITQLDGIRALAIILVLGRHGIRPFLDSNGEFFTVFGWDLATPLLNGWMGVDLFFVLSGFLIASSLMRIMARDDRTPRLTPYLLKRVLRIVPTYYVVMLVAAFGLFPYYKVAGEHLGTRVVYHVLFLQDYLRSDIVVAFWSLGVEEKFYITAPFIWYCVSRLRAPIRQYAALVGLLLLGPLSRTLGYLSNGAAESYETFFVTFRSPFHMSLDPLYMGVLVALLYRDRDRFSWTRHRPTIDGLFWAGGLMVGWLLLSHELLVSPLGFFDHSLQPLLLAVGMGVMVLALVLDGGPLRYFQGRKLFRISKLAYSLYLVHLLVIPGVIHGLEFWFNLSEQTFIVQFGLFVGPYLLVSGVTAAALFYLVEKPFLRLKDRVRYEGDESAEPALSRQHEPPPARCHSRTNME